MKKFTALDVVIGVAIGALLLGGIIDVAEHLADGPGPGNALTGLTASETWAEEHPEALAVLPPAPACRPPAPAPHRGFAPAPSVRAPSSAER